MKFFCRLLLIVLFLFPLQVSALTAFANARIIQIPHRIYRMAQSILRVTQQGKGGFLFGRITSSHYSVESPSLSHLRSYLQLLSPTSIANSDPVVLMELMRMEETNLRAIRAVLISDLFRGIRNPASMEKLHLALWENEPIIADIFSRGVGLSDDAIRMLKEFYKLSDDFSGQQNLIKSLTFEDFTILEDLLLESSPVIRIEIGRILPHLKNGKPSRARAYAYEALLGIRESLVRARIIEVNGRGFKILPSREGEIAREEVAEIQNILRAIWGRKELLNSRSTNGVGAHARVLSEDPFVGVSWKMEIGTFDPTFAGDVSRLLEDLSHIVGQLR